MDTCSVEGCDRPRCSRGLCHAHWQRLNDGRRVEGPIKERPVRDPLERFMEKVKVTDGCWEWMASRSKTGYGCFMDGRLQRAHRWLWERTYGPVPEGYELHHECLNRACVRLDHLRCVTHAENMAETIGMRTRTHCKRGHEMTVANTYLQKRKGSGREIRACRACRNEAMVRFRERQDA